MASENVGEWISRNAKFASGTVLEVGSRRFGEYLDFRALLPHLSDFTGVDLEAGDNVDVVVDLTRPFAEIDAKLHGRRFNTIMCTSVLEHVPNPFLIADNLQKLLASQGFLFISVPFVFRFHAYPGDYWRFTPEAIKVLFPRIDFDRQGKYNSISSLEPEDVIRIPEDFKTRNRFMFRPKDRESRIERKRMKLENPDTVRGDYSLAPTMVNMIGFNRE